MAANSFRLPITLVLDLSIAHLWIWIWIWIWRQNQTLAPNPTQANPKPQNQLQHHQLQVGEEFHGICGCLSVLATQARKWTHSTLNSQQPATCNLLPAACSPPQLCAVGLSISGCCGAFSLALSVQLSQYIYIQKPTHTHKHTYHHMWHILHMHSFATFTRRWLCGALNCGRCN